MSPSPPSPRRRRWLHRLAGLVGALLAVVVAVGAWVGIASARRIGRTYDVPVERRLVVPTDSASVARGRHLFTATAACALCHGDDGGGAVYEDAGRIGYFAGPNLTRGRGGAGARLGDEDWERAVRHGVRRDGTSLIMMPSEVYAHLTDADLAAIIAWTRATPPVDREIAPTHFGPMGRALLAAGKLPLLVAAKTPRVAHAAAVSPAPTAAYGRYLADIGGCRGCHGFGLSGGRVAGPPDLPPAANLTPAGIGGWTEADFVRALRVGRRPDGSGIHPFMPWPVLGRMRDDELRALWLYLRSVPSRATGTR